MYGDVDGNFDRIIRVISSVCKEEDIKEEYLRQCGGDVGGRFISFPFPTILC